MVACSCDFDQIIQAARTGAPIAFCKSAWVKPGGSMPYLCTRIGGHVGNHQACGTAPPDCAGTPLATWDDSGVGESAGLMALMPKPKSYLHEAKALFIHVLDCLRVRKF